MVKLIFGLIISLVLVSPSFANNYEKHGRQPQHNPHYGHQHNGHNNWRHQHYYNRPYYSNNHWYWAAPLALGVVTGYVLANPYDQPQLRRDIDGRLYELRSLYFDDCRCYKQVWVMIQ